MTRGSRNTWEGGKEGMRPPKSHLTQIDCSPLCQSQLLAQTATPMCACAYLRVCVWAETLIISPPCARCLLYNRLLYLLHMLSQVSLLSLFLIFKCLYLDSDENWEVTSAYPVSRQALGHVQNHCGLVLLHFLNWNHLVREKEKDKRWDLRIDSKIKN